jgi:hypothetical protein
MLLANVSLPIMLQQSSFVMVVVTWLRFDLAQSSSARSQESCASAAATANSLCPCCSAAPC